jgi:hypothetical protein
MEFVCPSIPTATAEGPWPICAACPTPQRYLEAAHAFGIGTATIVTPAVTRSEFSCARAPERRKGERRQIVETTMPQVNPVVIFHDRRGRPRRQPPRPQGQVEVMLT